MKKFLKPGITPGLGLIIFCGMVCGLAAQPRAWLLKDTQGNTILELGDLRGSPCDEVVGSGEYSTKVHVPLCELSLTAKNVSGLTISLSDADVHGALTFKGGAGSMFWLKPAKKVLVPEETTELRGSNLMSGPKDLESVETVELKFGNLFRSPQEKERDAKLEAEAAAERAEARAACAAVYRSTIDKRDKEFDGARNINDRRMQAPRMVRSGAVMELKPGRRAAQRPGSFRDEVCGNRLPALAAFSNNSSALLQSRHHKSPAPRGHIREGFHHTSIDIPEVDYARFNAFCPARRTSM